MGAWEVMLSDSQGVLEAQPLAQWEGGWPVGALDWLEAYPLPPVPHPYISTSTSTTTNSSSDPAAAAAGNNTVGGGGSGAVSSSSFASRAFTICGADGGGRLWRWVVMEVSRDDRELVSDGFLLVIT